MTEIQKYAEAPAVLTPAERGSSLIREAAAVMTDAHALATAICKTAMVPDHFRGKPDETAAAILYGASLGLDPMQSLKAVYVVYGNAAMYARSMAGLVVAAGHEIWTVESGPTRVVVAGRRKGTGEDSVETADWTIERATIAGYVPTKDPATGKWKTNEKGKVIGNEKYLTDPQAMLRAKATAEVCRIIAPDVLAGVYSVEERQMEYVEAEVVSTRPTRGLAAVLPASEEQPAAADQPEAGSPFLNPRSGLAKRMFAALGEAGITSKDDRLDYCSGQVGREVKSSGELTDVEAEAIIASLQFVQESEAEAAPEAEQ